MGEIDGSSKNHLGSVGVKIRGDQNIEFPQTPIYRLLNTSESFSVDSVDFVEHFALNIGHSKPCMIDIFIGDANH